MEHPYERGRSDYADGKPFSQNPFIGSNEQEEWERGWCHEYAFSPRERTQDRSSTEYVLPASASHGRR